MLAARAFPPARPPRCCASFAEGNPLSFTSPVAMSTMSLASWAGSRGRLGVFMRANPLPYRLARGYARSSRQTPHDLLPAVLPARRARLRHRRHKRRFHRRHTSYRGFASGRVGVVLSLEPCEDYGGSRGGVNRGRFQTDPLPGSSCVRITSARSAGRHCRKGTGAGCPLDDARRATLTDAPLR